MKLYGAFGETDYSPSHLFGVYSTKEKAEEAIKRCGGEHYDGVSVWDIILDEDEDTMI
jgi:hypothetical protein